MLASESEKNKDLVSLCKHSVNLREFELVQKRYTKLQRHRKHMYS